MKKATLISLTFIGIIGVGFGIMVGFKICPPTGPWPQPPWCEKECTTCNPPITPVYIESRMEIITPDSTDRVSILINGTPQYLVKNTSFYFTGQFELENSTQYELIAYNATDAILGRKNITVRPHILDFIPITGDGRELVKGFYMSACDSCAISYSKDGFLAEARIAYQEMKLAGATWVDIVPQLFVDNYTASEVRAIYRDEYRNLPHSDWSYATFYDSELRQLIRDAHAVGLKVYMIPFVNPINWSSENPKGKGDLEPSNLTAFFNSYISYIEHYGTIAEEENVELFGLGSEMDTLTMPNLPQNGGINKTEAWYDVIAHARAVYNGNLTYSVSCFTQEYNNPANIKFWDRLDIIGFEWYVPFTANVTAEFAEILAGAEWVIANFILPLSTQYGKPVIFTEVGFEAKPHSWTRSYAGTSDEGVDRVAAMICYEALFQAIQDVPEILGLFVFTWTLGPQSVFNWIDIHNGNEVRYTPVLPEISKWFHFF
jgi:hypothetical protein